MGGDSEHPTKLLHIVGDEHPINHSRHNVTVTVLDRCQPTFWCGVSPQTFMTKTSGQIRPKSLRLTLSSAEKFDYTAQSKPRLQVQKVSFEVPEETFQVLVSSHWKDDDNDNWSGCRYNCRSHFMNSVFQHDRQRKIRRRAAYGSTWYVYMFTTYVYTRSKWQHVRKDQMLRVTAVLTFKS